MEWHQGEVDFDKDPWWVTWPTAIAYLLMSLSPWIFGALWIIAAVRVAIASG